MSTDNSSPFLVPENTLGKLAGIDNTLSSIECSQDEYLMEVPHDEGTLSVEIVTLYQHQYELAFNEVMQKAEYQHINVDEMSYIVEDVIPNYFHIQPHVMVNDGEITVVVDCTKIDTQIVEFASKLLSTIPSLEPGFYWEYNKTEK